MVISIYCNLANHIYTAIPYFCSANAVDHHATGKHPNLKHCSAALAPYYVHCTPIYGCWLNQVKIWFDIITQKVTRRGSFRSVKPLIANIGGFAGNHTPKSKP
jgi:hypothetical protein